MDKSPEQEESKESFIDLGVALNLEGLVLEQAHILAKQIKGKAKYVFTLDENALPHITLFQGRFVEGVEGRLEELLKELLKEGIGELEMEDRLFFRPNGNVFWNVKDNQVLRDLHEKLNTLLISETQGLLMDQFQKIIDDPNASETDKLQIKKYGALLAGDKFLPHVTLGRLINLEDRKLLEDIKVPTLTFHPKHFILGNLGSYGEVKTVISNY